MTPFTERSGKFSPLKTAVFAALFIPGVVLAFDLWMGRAGPRPITSAIHETGDWAIRFLMISLAVTPLRRIGNFPKLFLVRRMLGLAALAYALGHFMLYIVDLNFDLGKVASEIVLRYYLTIAFAALLGLIVLGATSFDAAIRRMGPLWNRLHKIVYAIAVLAVLHYFMQSKADAWHAALMGGLFVLLMLYRLAQAKKFDLASPLPLVGIAVMAALSGVLIEYLWYEIATGIPGWRVVLANLSFTPTIRPSWWVLVTGLAVAALALVRKSSRPAAPRQRARQTPAAA